MKKYNIPTAEYKVFDNAEDVIAYITEKNEFPYRFYVSDLADEFKAFANSILPYDVEMTKKIDIEKY